MQANSNKPEAYDLVVKLFKIVNELLHPDATLYHRHGLSTFSEPPFDISKPNQHNTKADFEREYKIVSESTEALFALLKLLLRTEGKDKAKIAELNRLGANIDEKMRENAPTGPFETAHQLVRRSVVDAGGF